MTTITRIVLILCALLAGQLGLARSASGQQTLVDYMKASEAFAADGIAPGDSLDMRAPSRPMPFKAVQATTRPARQIYKIDGDAQYISSFEEYKRFRSTSVEVTARGSWGAGGANVRGLLDESTSFEHTEQTVSFKVVVFGITGKRLLENPKLTQDALTDYANLTRNDFISKYGTHYIAAVFDGWAAEVTIEATGLSSRERHDVEYALQLAVRHATAKGTLEAEVKQQIEKVITQATFRGHAAVTAKTPEGQHLAAEALTVTNWEDIEDVIEALWAYVHTASDKPVAIGYQSAPLRDVNAIALSKLPSGTDIEGVTSIDDWLFEQLVQAQRAVKYFDFYGLRLAAAASLPPAAPTAPPLLPRVKGAKTAYDLLVARIIAVHEAQASTQPATAPTTGSAPGPGWLPDISVELDGDQAEGAPFAVRRQDGRYELPHFTSLDLETELERSHPSALVITWNELQLDQGPTNDAKDDNLETALRVLLDGTEVATLKWNTPGALGGHQPGEPIPINQNSAPISLLDESRFGWKTLTVERFARLTNGGATVAQQTQSKTYQRQDVLDNLKTTDVVQETIRAGQSSRQAEGWVRFQWRTGG